MGTAFDVNTLTTSRGETGYLPTAKEIMNKIKSIPVSMVMADTQFVLFRQKDDNFLMYCFGLTTTTILFLARVG